MELSQDRRSEIDTFAKTSAEGLKQNEQLQSNLTRDLYLSYLQAKGLEAVSPKLKDMADGFITTNYGGSEKELKSPQELECFLDALRQELFLPRSGFFPLESLQKLYEEVRVYDLHYSNMRATLCTFLTTVGFGIIPLMSSGALPSDTTLLYWWPVGPSFVAVLVSAYFLKLTHCCKVIQKEFESWFESSDAIKKIVRVDFEKLAFRKRLKGLMGRDQGGKEVLLNPISGSMRNFDTPHSVLTILFLVAVFLGGAASCNLAAVSERLPGRSAKPSKVTVEGPITVSGIPFPSSWVKVSVDQFPPIEVKGVKELATGGCKGGTKKKEAAATSNKSMENPVNGVSGTLHDKPACKDTTAEKIASEGK